MSGSLYEHDFYSWTNEQAALLRSGQLSAADIEHIAEEIESLGRSELRAMESALVRIIEHLLKLQYSPAKDPRSGWEESVDLHRDDLHRLKRDNPGLVHRLDIPSIYATAKRIAGKSLEHYDCFSRSVLPITCPFTLDQIEADDWYPTVD